jgi:hypothetical protein
MANLTCQMKTGRLVADWPNEASARELIKAKRMMEVTLDFWIAEAIDRDGGLSVGDVEYRSWFPVIGEKTNG